MSISHPTETEYTGHLDDDGIPRADVAYWFQVPVVFTGTANGYNLAIRGNAEGPYIAVVQGYRGEIAARQTFTDLAAAHGFLTIEAWNRPEAARPAGRLSIVENDVRHRVRGNTPRSA